DLAIVIHTLQRKEAFTFIVEHCGNVKFVKDYDVRLRRSSTIRVSYHPRTCDEVGAKYGFYHFANKYFSKPPFQAGMFHPRSFVKLCNGGSHRIAKPILDLRVGHRILTPTRSFPAACSSRRRPRG